MALIFYWMQKLILAFIYAFWTTLNWINFKNKTSKIISIVNSNAFSETKELMNSFKKKIFLVWSQSIHQAIFPALGNLIFSDFPWTGFAMYGCRAGSSILPG